MHAVATLSHVQSDRCNALNNVMKRRKESKTKQNRKIQGNQFAAEAWKSKDFSSSLTYHKRSDDSRHIVVTNPWSHTISIVFFFFFFRTFAHLQFATLSKQCFCYFHFFLCYCCCCVIKVSHGFNAIYSLNSCAILIIMFIQLLEKRLPLCHLGEIKWVIGLSAKAAWLVLVYYMDLSMIANVLHLDWF